MRRLSVTIVTTVLLVMGGYVAAALMTPLPELEPQLSVDATQEFVLDESIIDEVVASQSLPTAVGWAQDGADETVWSNSDSARPMASIVKLVTAIVCLEEQPVEEGTDGGTYTVTEADAAIRAEVLGQNGVAHDTPVGLDLSMRQLLQLVLMASSNNYAIAYANSVFGSQSAFADAANAWAAEHGLDSVRVTEASGLSERNVASAADLVRITRIALDHPLIAEVMATTSVEIPGLGLIESTNPLIDDDGVIGAKTGTLFESGYNLAAVRENSVEGRDLTAIVVTLGRDSAAERANDTRITLNGAVATAQPTSLVMTDSPVGSVLTWQGDVVSILTEGDASTVLAPGERATTTMQLDEVTLTRAKGTTIGSVVSESPTGSTEIPLVTTDAIVEPDGWWRLGNPGIVFGWQDPEPLP